MNKQPIILTYSAVVTEWTKLPENREAGADLYDVTSASFQDQMQLLKANQYNIGVLGDDSLAPNTLQVIITFDDGEMNNFDQAFPVLKQHGFSAYFFIIAKYIGHPGYMGWDELKELHEAGMTIGSHGFSHEILTNLLDTQIEEELRASKNYLERNLGFEVDTFSVPKGFCDDNVIQKAYDAGYKRIFISDRPRKLQSDCYSRVAVKASWSLERFKQALSGNTPFHERVFGVFRSVVKRIFGSSAYDWVRKALLR